MTTTKAQNQINKYFEKVVANQFEADNGILQTENQLAKKLQIENNYFTCFIKHSHNLTESQYYGMDWVNDLCLSYEEMLDHYEDIKFQ
jgi:hypothetical protein